MLDPAASPFLFDTSAESWLSRADGRFRDWFRSYLSHSLPNVSAATVVERVRGYALLWRKAAPGRRALVETRRVEYLDAPRRVWPIDTGVAVLAGEIMALLRNPPTEPRRSHLMVESRQERLVRWRFDILIASTALVGRMPLIHNNPADFEAIRTAIELSPGRFPGLGPLALVRCQALV